jgi:hypothetical protein
MRVILGRIIYTVWGCIVLLLIGSIAYRIATVGWEGFIAPAVKLSQQESAANRH